MKAKEAIIDLAQIYFAAIFFVIAVLGISANVKVFSYIEDKTVVVLTVVSSMYVVILVSIAVFIRIIKREYKLLCAKINTNLNESAKSIDQKLDPFVEFIETKSQIQVRVSESIERMINLNNSNGILKFYGSASLAPEKNVVSTLLEDEEREKKPEYKYYRSFRDAAHSKKVSIERYVRLLDTNNNQAINRTENYISNYLNWMESQIDLKKELGDAYKFYRYHRAPEYGSSGSYIITTDDAYIVYGFANAALRIKSTSIVEKMTNAIDAVYDKTPRVDSPHSMSTEELAAHIKLIRNYMSNKAK